MFGVFRNKKQSITDIKVKQDFDELKKRTRILVIDDNEDEFPFKLLRNEGYSIDYWQDIQELGKLENAYYDIIILDIGGVGSVYDKNNEGVGVLKHIKKVNPSQVVIAYSGQTHESSRIPFFKLADQYIPKPASAFTVKESLDNLIKTKITIQHFWPSLKKMLEEKGVSQDKINKVNSLLVDTIKTKDIDGFKPIFSEVIKGVDNLTTLTSIAVKIISLALGGTT